jgi:hypothetical protein
MTLTTIAPGVRLLRRHPTTDVLIVGGLGDWPTYFVGSIPGGWCVVNGERATTRIAEQISQCEQGMMPEEDMMNLPDGWKAASTPDTYAASGEDDGRLAYMTSGRPNRNYARCDAPYRNSEAEAAQDLEALIWALDPTRRAETARLKDAMQHITHALAGIAKPGETPERTIANLIADRDRAHQQRDTAERQQADTFYALIAERKTSANLRAEVRRLHERGILKRLLGSVVG